MYSPDGPHKKLLAQKLPLSFDGTQDFAAHQAQIKEKLTELLGETPERVPLDPIVEETVDRSVLWSVQTPQVFQADLIRAAVEQAVEQGVQVTDDCSIVEQLGMKVVLTPGDRENIKVTTPFDLILGQAILDLRQEEGR